MTPDYPAAHSMDTEWFAVDQDGHVAWFNSRESGAVPVDVHPQPEDGALGVLRDLKKAVRATAVLFEHSGRVRLGAPDHDRHRLFPFTTDSGPVLLFLHTLDLVKKELQSGQAREVKAVAGFAVLFKALKKGRAAQLHKPGGCIGCFFPHDEGEEEARDPDPAGLGLFTYKHLDPDTITGPYGRTKRPTQPARVGELPPKLRPLLERVKFASICFATAPQIQPVQHLKCGAWEPAWLDLDGVTQRCVPGMEKKYREYFEEMKDVLGAAIEPPPADR